MTATPFGPGQQPPAPQLAAAREQFPHWDIWTVSTPYDPAGPRTWCARPHGAAIATCHGKEPDTLACAIRRFTRNLTAHLAAARAELAGPAALTPAHRTMLQYQVTAMTRLQDRTPPPGTGTSTGND